MTAAVVLGDRNVREEAPCLAGVVALVEDAIVAEQEVVPVIRVEDDLVVVHVHLRAALPLRRCPCRAAVGAAREVGRDRIDVTGTVRIEEQLGVVLAGAGGEPAHGRRSRRCGRAVRATAPSRAAATPSAATTASTTLARGVAAEARPRRTCIGRAIE